MTYQIIFTYNCLFSSRRRHTSWPRDWSSDVCSSDLLEKSAFPREKVCGDGLTPRGVKALDDMGVDTSPATGWIRHKGLRVHGGGQVVEVDWPHLDHWPAYSLVRRRSELDAQLAHHAR